jgi:hypothetical protein
MSSTSFLSFFFFLFAIEDINMDKTQDVETVEIVKNGSKVSKARKFAMRTAQIALIFGVGTVAALAATGGPFSAITNFATTTVLPGVGGIAVLGGVGYAGIHAAKHEYGKGVVGLTSAGAGGFMIAKASWLVSQTGITTATIGHHLSLVVTAMHAIGL